MKNRAILYIHGQGGSAAEAEHYRALFPECEVIGLNYRAQTPWEAAPEFRAAYDVIRGDYAAVSLIAVSIGAYFAMGALADRDVERALLISPIVDMEALILGMMASAGVTEDALRAHGEIALPGGQVLSIDYLNYVRSHPVIWHRPTRMLCAGHDSFTPRAAFEAFAERTGAELRFMEDGEHWFHTDAQMAFLDAWALEKEMPV